MIRALHTSDLHGRYSLMLDCAEDFDLWIDTGDFFPNKTRGDVAVEPMYQRKWLGWENLPGRLVEFLDGRPALTVAGNHDYTSLAHVLVAAGGDAHEVTPDGIEVAGIRFAGFREIPYIAGEWNGETQQSDFVQIVARTLDSVPVVLLTHAPPAGILDSVLTHPVGIRPLIDALCYQEHTVKTHLFGHIHEHGGKSVVEMGVRFVNGACTAIVHSL